ncbi:hypothetical protein [Fusobacterium polymorphum]|uniref:hypothetical protein n=1 Tax=Fusobacterium nucleatum subsp. polymorphum TaxID=76857 RepID=UPI00291CF989|nr:hypothetical protein FNCP4_10910 [Fusobacterium nucleatum]BEP03954.1 hypothetical protein FNSP4_16880 [Fusobacterium nucleatum]
MLDIFIYVCIILFGVFLVRKKLVPEKLLKKVSLLQSLSLYLLLGAMGYKIGADDRLISNLHVLGVKALIISVFAIVFSILFVKLFYWRDKK